MATLFAILYVVVFLTLGHIRKDSDSMESLNWQFITNIILSVQILVDAVMGFFICFFILKFSEDNAVLQLSEEATTHESLALGHIPNLVYMQNQKVL